MILQPASWGRGGGGGSVNFRENIFLLGSYNGVNRTFTLPERAIQSPPGSQVKVYHGGRRLQPIEYAVRESVPGGGYDTVDIIFAPPSTSKLYADYVAV